MALPKKIKSTKSKKIKNKIKNQGLTFTTLS